ncbi:MAG: hypothetical protein JWQ34_2624 [Mucilaginibacter sp.]|uniref:metallophosphoesterase family protein n=1 Tax=Mucilaginibacter sp. TaxID=1882438 RepID=UPI0026153C4A|nr:hypothetical protein [Mucilaginibacter sp.]MDB5004399.1 hypothetical protein [Mucilaginibacter sp.]
MDLSQEKARIWFFTDIHGSNACFRKLLNLPATSAKPNVIIVGADITGKQIIPIVEASNKRFSLKVGGITEKIKQSDLSTWETKLGDIGYYPYVCSQNEYNSLILSEDKQREIFDLLAKKRLEEWIALANQKLPGIEECQFIINAGNDDPFFVDALLDGCPKFIRPEGKVLDLPGNLKLLSTGYSSITPWKCPRDITEEAMAEKINEMTSQLKPGDKFIFNFHCPPYNTSLDEANEIDVKTFKPLPGRKTHAGSKAVKAAIEVWKPMVGLHGHIHEVRAKQMIGDTLCFNPGTDYKSGKLQGVFLQMDANGIELDRLTEERDPPAKEGINKQDIKKALSNIPGVGKLFEEKLSRKEIEGVEAKVEQILEILNKK